MKITDVFKKKGVSKLINSNDNFFELLLKYDKIERKSTINTVDDIKNFILNKINKKKYYSLNNGNLQFKFQNYRSISNFQNYIEYTISDQKKVLEYFYECLLLNGGIFKNDLKLLVIDYEIIGSNENVNLRCLNFTNIKIEKGDNVGLCICYNGVYELIGKYSSINSKNIFKYGDNINPYISYLIEEFNNNQTGCQQPIRSQLINNLHKSTVIKEKINIDIILSKIEDVYTNRIFVVDSYKKIIGILISKNDTDIEYLIPIYPQIKIFKDTNPKKITLKSYYEQCNEPKYNRLPSFNDYFTILSKYDNSVKHFQSVIIQDVFKGSVLNTGHYIRLRIDEEISNDNILNIEPSEIDNKILESKHAQMLNNYRKPLTQDEIKKILPEDSLTEIKLNKLLVAYKFENIYIPVKTRENKSDYILSDIENIEYDDYIEAVLKISQHYNYKLNCLPIRCKLDDTDDNLNLDKSAVDFNYTHIVLETGLQLKLKSPFKINQKYEKGSIYKIERIINDLIIDQIYGNFIPDNSSIIQSKRVIQHKKLVYNSKILDILRMEVYLLFKSPDLVRLKNIIIKILKSNSYNKSVKKLLISPVIHNILNLLIIKDESSKYPELDIENSCNNNLVENEFCTDRVLKKLPVIENYIDYAFRLCPELKLKQDSTLNKFEIEAAEEIKEIYNSYIKDKDSALNLRQLKIIDPENKLILNLKNDILNNIVYNIYRRNQLFEKYSNNDVNNKYKIHEPNEYIFSHYDYNISILDSIYHIRRKKYYNDIVPFDLIDYNLVDNYDTKILANCYRNDTIYKETFNMIKKTQKTPAYSNLELNNIKCDNNKVKTLYNIIYNDTIYPNIIEGCIRKDTIDNVTIKYD